MKKRTARATARANIALAKYWGKSDVALNLPAVPSISLTLDGLVTTTTVTFDETLTADVGVVAEVLHTAAGELLSVTRPDGTDVILAQTTAIEAFDPQADGNGTVSEDLKAQFRTQAADDLLALYTDALRRERGVTVNQNLIDATLTRFP